MLTKVLKKLIHKLKVGKNYFCNRIEWQINFLFPKKFGGLSSEKRYLELLNGRKIFFVPHADDEILGAGVYLSQTPDIKLIYCGFTGSNQDPQNALIRKAEYKRYCSKSHLASIELYNDVEVFDALKEAKYIFLPSIIDWHDEHRYVNWLLLKMCNELNIGPTIIWYCISVPIVADNYVFYNPMNKKKFNKKFRTFTSIYKSQKKMPIMRFKVQEKIYGYECGAYAAEKFILLSYENWKQSIEIFLNKGMESEVKKMNKNINSLKEIYNQSEDFYKRIFKTLE